MTAAAVSTAHVLVPVRRADLMAGAACTVLPAIAVTVALAVEGGHPERVVPLIACLLVEAAVLVALVLRVRVVLDRDGAVVRLLRGRGTRLRRGQVRSAVFRTVYGSGSLDRRRHLFLLDGKGAVALRITDFWWRPQDLTAVAQHFEVPIETVPETLTQAELRRLAPGQLHWWERHPLLGQVAELTAIAVGCCVLARIVALAA